MVTFTVDAVRVTSPAKPCGVWSMLYITPFRAAPSLEILNTVRSSCLGSMSVPCQVPVMSCANSAPADNAARAIVREIGFFIEAPYVD